MIFFLAQQSHGFFSQALAATAGILVTVGLLSGLLLMLLQGFWAKSVAPRIQEAILSWYGSEAQLKARKVEFESLVQGWNTQPSQVDDRRRAMRDLIDNEIRRDDGLIKREITQTIERVVAPLQSELTEIKKLLLSRNELDQRFRDDMFTRLAHLEGLVSSVSPIPPGTVPVRYNTPPRPPVVKVENDE